MALLTPEDQMVFVTRQRDETVLFNRIAPIYSASAEEAARQIRMDMARALGVPYNLLMPTHAEMEGQKKKSGWECVKRLHLSLGVTVTLYPITTISPIRDYRIVSIRREDNRIFRENLVWSGHSFTGDWAKEVRVIKKVGAPKVEISVSCR